MIRALTLSASILFAALPALSDEIAQLPVTATFVVSGGFWQAGAEGLPLDGAEAKVTGSGYYKLVSIRQPDRTTKIYLQMISVSEAGLSIVESVELEEFTVLKPYVTGIQPETTSGVKATPGFFATVYLKTDAASQRIEEWTVLIDELGDIRVERASN